MMAPGSIMLLIALRSVTIIAITFCILLITVLENIGCSEV
jgi:hypothetical protein